MKTRVRSHFWIPDLNSLVKEKVSTSDTCQRFTSKTTKEPVAAQKTSGVGWEEVSIDLFGPLPNKKHVLVVQDIMSRFPAASIVPNTSATPVIEALDKVYTSYGQPQRHRTDNGPPFNSQDFAQYSHDKGIDQVLSYPYHPQGNPCETFMKPLGKALKAAFHNRDSAQQALDDLVKAYRSTPHPATGVAPGDVLFRYGYQAGFPSKMCTEDEVAAAVEKDREQKRQRTNEMNRSPKRKQDEIRVGDKVLLREYPKGHKFNPIYNNEAAEVTQVDERGVVVKEANGKRKRRHKDDVKLYHEMHSSCWPAPEEEEDGSGGEQHVVPGIQVGQLEDGEAGEGHAEATGELAAAQEEAGRAPAVAVDHVRPRRERNLPSRLKDYVLLRVQRAKGKGGQ